ncbi:hypothetical protein PpBr36_04126 [Pyricularia pennisetigena]|uniref:hypothetical protein n=1 Tax=Pyricularia pennisetigena TaxID=1578925 RepID=UPI001152BD33|nr:hypothetical protein PpBr36_04126 [Pyricularia pennisetigena]TLS26886.1 hypothetical protein PpBr36_04126 [Pyricularia pennisetigena]
MASRLAAGLRMLALAGTATAVLTWDEAYAKANAALARITQQDKVNIVSGIGWDKGPCVGNTAPVSAINYPQLCLQDGPTGVRFGTGVTAFTPGIQAASTWDVELMRQRGQFQAEEQRGCGVHVMLTPVAGALGKIPEGGRNWEGFGVDPYLVGIAMEVTIKGQQSVGVQATAKHYLLNEQELNRETMSSNVDDRTLHELYLWPFADAVRADVASVMCSYNKINGSWACENEHAMQKLLKDELGFKGYVMSDWNAQHTTTGSANAGMDMTMPGSDFNGGNVLWGPQLTTAVNNNQVARSRLDDMARRVLAAWYLTEQDKGYPATNIRANVQGNHKENVRAVARDGIVLLKNDAGALPFKAPRRLAIVGSAAVANPRGINSCVDRGCNEGALGMGWGSGTTNYPYFSAPADAIRARAQQDGATVSLSASDSTANVADTVRDADAAIVFLTSNSGEGYLVVDNIRGDRNDLNPLHNGNQLVQAVAQANKNVIVVVHSVGPLILETILNTPGVTAVVWAGLPGQESGNALVDVLYGSVSPSGKLPYTIARQAGDYGTAVARGDDNFSEGLFVDYRHFDRANIQPRFEFGYGLSYTNFTYSNIKVASTARSGPATGPVVPGGRADLWETVATVTATVTNSGPVTGAEVAQLYVSYPTSGGAPATPPRQLRGFAKLKLAPGASGTATFNIRRRDLSYWHVGQQNWVVPAGAFGVDVGASSRDLRLKGSISVA